MAELENTTARQRDPSKPKRQFLSVEKIRKDEGADSDYASEGENGDLRPDKPCHKSCESLFSSDSGFQNYRGLLNDCILLLVLSNAKNVITNLLKYGILVDLTRLTDYILDPGRLPCYALLTVSWVFPLVALKSEQLASKNKLSDKALMVCHILSLFILLSFPVAVIFTMRMGPAGSLIALGWYTVFWMKLVSYMQVNWWCRTSQAKKKDDDPNQKSKHLVRYPDNLNLKDLVYFCFAPTLCYELNFPRTKKIRKVFLLRRILESIFLFNLLMVIFQQWIMPTVLNSVQPFRDMDYTRMIERVLLLALPNHLFWLLGFYWYFHSSMNLLAELLHFADRQFYGDWWNAQTIRGFWKTWNIPVHRWASRHVYNPLAKSWKCPKLLAQGAVFVLSAFFHEYLVSIPLLMLRPWAFTAMIGQVPLGALTSFRFMQGQLGNVIVWTSIVLGQPIAILMYLHDYYWIHWAPLIQNGTEAAA